MANSNLNLIAIDDTKFMFAPNLAGDPTKSKFGAKTRTCTIVVPDPHQVQDLRDKGVEVFETSPREDDDPDDFVPTYFVRATLSYRNKYGELLKYLPDVYLVNADEEAVPMDEETVGTIDNIRVTAIHVVLNAAPKKDKDGYTLYIKTMYVEQDFESDPYINRFKRYRGRRDDD